MTDELSGSARQAVQIAQRSRTDGAVMRALAPRVEVRSPDHGNVVYETVRGPIVYRGGNGPPVHVEESVVAMDPVMLWPHRIAYFGYSENSHTAYFRGDIDPQEAKVLAVIAAHGLTKEFESMFMRAVAEDRRLYVDRYAEAKDGGGQ